MLQNISVSNKCCSVELSINQKYDAAQLLTLIAIINVSLTANQHIIMISEGSCDTEDWSNDAENTALYHSNKLQFIQFILNCNNIS